MPRRIWVFCFFAAVSAALFLRLGVWQSMRHLERQRHNALVAHQKQAVLTRFVSLPRDTGEAHYRAAVVNGRFDYTNEIVASPRTRRGSPGVELLTPVRVAGSDTAILVNRGWVYSPDAATVDRKRWMEGDSAHLTGYVELFADDTVVTTASDPRIVRRVSQREIASKVPYPVAPYYLVATGDTADLAHPARRDLPAMDEGPHRGYAIQWFSFAAIAVIGAGIVVYREKQDRGVVEGSS
ncbi:MAG: SURF1 family protein [Gemmatimonadota bacterium]